MENNFSQMSMLEVAYTLMKQKRTPQPINKLITEVLEIKNLTDEDGSLATQLYIDITTSSKFVYMGNNEWDLKERQTLDEWDKDGSAFNTKEADTADLDEEEEDFDDGLNDFDDEEEEDDGLEDDDDDVEEDEDFDDDDDDDEEDEEDDDTNDFELDDDGEPLERYTEEDEDFDEDKYNDLMDDFEDMYEN